ncbi:MAG TPA: type II toxin-antitoxin system MqsR family toxin [Telmatospirillum sp.]|nr:type II toxin-antitoxin system MqsR family toxin [Telmatospirillum sp.]
MDKRTPTYDVEAFKAAVAEGRADFTRTAVRTAQALGFDIADMKAAIALMNRRQFYKSMTSLADHRVWQDVYHLHHEGLLLYIKFTAGVVCEFTLLSFKEK